MPNRDPRLSVVSNQPNQSNQPETHSEEVKSLLNRIRELESQVSNPMGGLPRTPGLRVSPKGAVSMYGIHANFPVTLYPEQWDRVFEQQQLVDDFIAANKDVLNFKDDTPEITAVKEAKRTAAGIVPRTNIRTERIETAANKAA